jgi:shikimate dehydrogenase
MTGADERPLLAGVMGWPVKHSRSPLLFGHWFAQHGIAGAYVRLAVRGEDFEQVLRALPKAGFRGVNVTLPHKLAALTLADEATSAAQAIGAANTLIFRADGEITADNTDGYGFLENVRAGAPGWDPAGGPALVLGAGGAARAILHSLLEAGAPTVRLANRTRETAARLAQRFGSRVQVIDWASRSAACAGAGLIVNTTSLGMTGKPPLKIVLDDAPAASVVTDIVYAPLDTGLLTQARTRGLTTVDGLGMLLHQARPGFRAWFGVEGQVTQELRKAVLEGAM